MNFINQEGGKQRRKAVTENINKAHDSHMRKMVCQFIGFAIIIFLIFLATN